MTQLITMPTTKRKQPCQEVEYGYIFVNIFAKKNLTITPILFYGTLLSRHTVDIEPTKKPIILGYQADVDT